MKTVTTIFLMLTSFWCIGQKNSRLLGEYSVKGTIHLEGNDSIASHPRVVVTDLTTTERRFTWFTSVEPDGNFEVKDLKEGSYSLRFFVNVQDYYSSDTIVSATGKPINQLEIKLRACLNF